MSEALTLGVHHVGLSVPDLEAARDFFVEALGFEVVGGVPDYPAIFVSDGATMLTLWRVANPATATPFDRRANIGLHHLALKVADHAALHRAFARVKAHPGVAVEFAPGPVRQGAALHHCVFAIPGGVRCEIIAAA